MFHAEKAWNIESWERPGYEAMFVTCTSFGIYTVNSTGIQVSEVVSQASPLHLCRGPGLACETIRGILKITCFSITFHNQVTYINTQQ